MKILYLITKSNFGGAQKYVYELAVAAKAAGHDVSVAFGGRGEAGAASGLLSEKLETASISTTHIRSFMRDVSLWRDICAFFEVWRLVRHTRPTVLHVTSSKAGAIGALAGRLSRVPRIIFTSHGLTMDETWRPRWQRALIAVGTWLTIRLTHQSIMISTETYERTRRLWGLKHRVTRVFNGIDNPTLLPTTEARVALLQNLPAGSLWIGGIGELHKNKNWSVVIETLPLLPTNVHLVVMGEEGGERQALETLAKKLGVSERIHLIGYIADASQYLTAFDVFLLPSLKEGLPYVLLEAGLAKRAVVASDLPGIRDIICTPRCGILISPSVGTLRDSLVPLLEDAAKRSELGEALYDAVSTRFSKTTMLQETFALYTTPQ